MTDFKGKDPIKVAKDEAGVVQELRDRSEWPKAPVEVVEVESEPEVEKPRRGRPAAKDKADDAE